MSDDQVPTTQPGSTDPSQVRVKALAVVLDADRSRHLVFRARNQAGQDFHRPLGGGVEPGERAAEAVVREIAEELGATFRPEALLGVVENIFELDGQLGHEVVFLFTGTLAEADIVPPEGRVFHDNGDPGWAEWRPVHGDDDACPLYPDELQRLLDDWLARPTV